MIRIGIVDFDTSHAVEFTKRLNHIDIEQLQWVEGAKIVGGVPGQSQLSPEVIPKNIEAMKKYGVPLFDKPEDLYDKIDAVLIEAVDGSVHLDRAMPFLERGIPMFVDKPFACSLAHAKAMIDLATRKHVPLMSSSSLRYAPEVVKAKSGTETGKLVGATTYGPAPLDPKGRNPGLFHYGIHPVEMLFTLMGPGCERVTCLASPDGEVATGLWSGGRIASIRGLRKGNTPYGFIAFGEKSVVTQGVSPEFIYRELLKQIVNMFTTKEMPIDLRETLEIVAFIEAAKASAEGGGQSVKMSL